MIDDLPLRLRARPSVYAPVAADALEAQAARIADLHGWWWGIRQQLTDAQARIAELERERDALKLQAQCWAAKARAQSATVREAYRACTGGTGEPGDWNGANPVKERIAELEAALESCAVLFDDIASYEDGHQYTAKTGSKGARAALAPKESSKWAG
jgi:phage shock protein A